MEYKKAWNIRKHSVAALGKIVFIMSLVMGGLFSPITVNAMEAEYQDTIIEVEGFQYPERIHDENRDTYSRITEKGTVTVSREDGIGAVYIEFDRIPQSWTLTDLESGTSIVCGENAFLHEFVDVEAMFGGWPNTLTMSFEEGTVVADIYVFSGGDVPAWVQKWQSPCEEADLLLISSHSDDEQLFFSGILPYYAGECGLKVQVAYVVQHFEANNVKNHQRPHEQLDGLWTVGVKNYPVMSEFPDLYAESKDRETAFAQASAVYENVGITYDDFVCYITECLRRFKPLVVVSHDLDGEYGHGTHVLCASALTEAIEYAGDESKYPESAAKYGTWRVEKTYLHLYEENPIVMDFDIPLESFDGKTAFEVSQDGFACHKSQHWTWFYKWIYGTAEKPITRAADIKKYSPCLYGLYDTQVGPDTAGGDFLENVETYAERALAQERAKAEAEAAQKAQAEAEEAARKAKAEAQEAAQRAQEEAAAIAQAQAQAAEPAKAEAERKNTMLVASVILCTGIVFGGIMLLCRRRSRTKASKSKH